MAALSQQLKGVQLNRLMAMAPLVQLASKKAARELAATAAKEAKRAALEAREVQKAHEAQERKEAKRAEHEARAWEAREREVRGKAGCKEKVRESEITSTPICFPHVPL